MRNEHRPGNATCRVAIAVAVLSVVGRGQTPVISSVVDAASFTATQGTPGSIVAIFGTNLAASTAAAQSSPLPYELAGTTVTWNGLPAPLFYVSPTQINLQVPAQKDKNGGAGIVVSSAAGSGAYDTTTATPDVWERAGFFSANVSGCGQAAALNVAADGSLSVNSAANSASPGGWVSTFLTGMPQDPWPDDIAAPLSPLWPIAGVNLFFDFSPPPLNSTLSVWSGRAPGLVGVDQVNFQLPSAVREGCAVPVWAAYYGIAQGLTQPVTLAIRKGGGPCVDPPEAGYGQITFQKTTDATGPTSLDFHGTTLT